METAIMVLVVMGIVGVFFGVVLAVANKKFAIDVNPLIHLVEDVLPKGQCGACGFPGCQAYAEAVVLDPDVSPNLCIPGKAVVANQVAQLTGKSAPPMEARTAHVKCAGTLGTAVRQYKYEGIQDCVAASMLLGGPKGCQYGCVGFGTCKQHCPFGAITLGHDGLPIIDKNKCTGCGKCETVCPKNCIEMVPEGAHVLVQCNSNHKGAAVKKYCSTPCIGCGLCVKNCNHAAIKLVNNLAVVNYQTCIDMCNNPKCVAKCPTGAIKAELWGVIGKEEVLEKEEALV